MDKKYITLSEGVEKIIDYRGKTPKKLGGDWVEHGIRTISAKNVHDGILDNIDSIRCVTEEIYEKWMKEKIQRNDIFIASEGASMGESMIWESDEQIVLGQRLFAVRVNPEVLNPFYLAMYMRTPEYRAELENHCTGTSVMGLSQPSLLKTKIRYIPIEKQNYIGTMYQSICGKIATNTEINNNLEQQVQTLFTNMFIENKNQNRHECRADEFFDISIGKTPPRKESQWFSKDSAERVWVSISDMGNCGMYISDSSEYLTHEAVDRFNLKIVPDNTVLLSFKLTVGRVAITDGEVTTNEAIAHFRTSNTEITEYLYCYLKNFNYQAMGSTSSIATAVNSKIIKAMPFIVPTTDELKKFHAFAAPIFNLIKINQQENIRLALLRDSLLPKLMSGEIDLSNMDF